MALLWCWRWAEHASALNLVQQANVTSAPIQRIAAMPYPINPWRWHALIETDSTWQTAEVDTRIGRVESDPKINSLFKPQNTAATQAARQTRLGQVYLDWSKWPVVRDLGPQPIPGRAAPDFPPTRPWSTVEFRDLRFAYPFLSPSMDSASNQGLEELLNKSALSGYVYILDGHEEAGQFMNGREQK